jgi:hypothetical protein
MIRILLTLALLASSLSAQDALRWYTTGGDQVLTAQTTALTVQQPATNGIQAAVDQVVVYCSVACNVTININGTAATTTAGTITPLLPTPLNAAVPLNSFTSSNVGAGTQQGPILHVAAGATVTLCFTQACGSPNQFVLPPGAGTSSNFTVNISSITGTANIAIYGRSYRS